MKKDTNKTERQNCQITPFTYGEDIARVGEVYQLFSTCYDMTVHRLNKIMYYFALNPPLSNADISKLLGVSDSFISIWRRRLPPETAQKAVVALGINAQGTVAGKAASSPDLPAKEAQDE